jgi:uncharacterized protein (DUF433 family)
MDATDPRARVPVCTPSQLAQLVDMPVSTVYSWMKETATRPPLIHSVEPRRRGWASIPLIGVAEAAALRPLRRGGMRMREISAAVSYLREKGGEFALANPSLLHDGTVALLREDGLVSELRTGQGVFAEFLDQLHQFRLAPDGFVEAYLSEIEGTPVEIDPRFSSGRMRLTSSGIPIFAVHGMLQSGEPAEVVAHEFGIDLADVRAIEHADPDWLSKVA